MKLLTTIGVIAASSSAPISLAQTKKIVNDSDNLVDLDHNSSWLTKFQSTAPSFSLNADMLFSDKEKILSNNNYEILYQGSFNSKDIFSIYVKEIDKFYEIRVPWNSINRNHAFKSKLKNELGTELIEKFEIDMIKEKTIKTAVTTSSKGSKDREDIKAGSVSFRSSWGVSNSDTADFSGSVNIDKTALIEEINKSIGLKNNQIMGSIMVNEVQVLPLITVDDPPIDSAEFTMSNFNINTKKNSLAGFSPELPSGHGAGSEWWHGVTSSLSLVSSIILTAATGGLAAPSIGFGVIAGGLYSGISDSGKHGNLTANQEKIMKRLAQHKISLTPGANINSGINASFSGTFSGKAAAAIFGNSSKMSLEDIIFGFDISESIKIYEE